MVERRLDLRAGPRADERALYIHELNEMLRPEIDRRGLRSLYEDIELPLSDVLARMEHTGIRVDPDELARLSALLDTDIRRLTAEIHELAGREFNIASPQQLGKVLFEEMGLPAPVRYGKGKTISTAADVLENLAPEYPIVRKALDYRQLTKLKGTYVDVLPSLIDPDTGRVHTSFNQAGAATGRLSSSNPNLQHIPIRTELGREIRAAFLPREGWDLVVADYSQIELRLLAHMSGDPVLVDAFRKGEDIHTRTAAEVMGVPPMLVTKEARNNAKAVNFGIVYGISSFGLAANLGISKKEADLYIRSYFERYAGVRRFIDETIAKTRETGVARTLFGRERPIPDMNSRNSTARGFAERTAVNSPIQGTAADLIKLAMVRIDRAIAGWQSKLLVQVHDELVLESPPEESQRIRELVKREMESVCDLTVPLWWKWGRERTGATLSKVFSGVAAFEIIDTPLVRFHHRYEFFDRGHDLFHALVEDLVPCLSRQPHRFGLMPLQFEVHGERIKPFVDGLFAVAVGHDLLAFQAGDTRLVRLRNASQSSNRGRILVRDGHEFIDRLHDFIHAKVHSFASGLSLMPEQFEVHGERLEPFIDALFAVFGHMFNIMQSWRRPCCTSG